MSSDLLSDVLRGQLACADCAGDNGVLVFLSGTGRCPSCLSARLVPADKVHELAEALRKFNFRATFGRSTCQLVFDLMGKGPLDDLVRRGVEEAESGRRAMIRVTVEGGSASKIPGRFYEGHSLARAGMDVVWSVGSTPRRAVAALGRVRRWGKLARFEVLEGGDAAYTWGFRFIADGGTGMKAAGIHVPGGAICTWWK